MQAKRSAPLSKPYYLIHDDILLTTFVQQRIRGNADLVRFDIQPNLAYYVK